MTNEAKIVTAGGEEEATLQICTLVSQNSYILSFNMLIRVTGTVVQSLEPRRRALSPPHMFARLNPNIKKCPLFVHCLISPPVSCNDAIDEERAFFPYNWLLTVEVFKEHLF